MLTQPASVAGVMLGLDPSISLKSFRVCTSPEHDEPDIIPLVHCN